MSPKVTIQIPTYNQEQYIAQSLGSCLAQDYPNLEIVVADDCSTDRTREIVEGFNDPRIRYFRNHTNLGRVGNYRKALYEYSTGDWVVNLDGDDYYTDPAFIFRAMKLINDYTKKGHNVVFYQATMKLVNESGSKTTEKRHHVLGGKEHEVYSNYYPAIYRANHFFSHLTTVYSRNKAIEVGFYENDILNTDLESLARLSFHGEVILDQHCIGVWREHESNATWKMRDAFRRDGYEILQRLEKYRASVNGEGDAQKDIERQHKELYLEQLAEYGLFFGLLRTRRWIGINYRRTPRLLVKALYKNIKFKLRGKL
jgi:glycosyltransferase involved in cell wall biosynthesis